MKIDILKGIDAVIFDLDGTLADSMGMWKEIDREYLSRFDILLPEGLQAEIEGMSFTETAVYFKERFQIPDSIEAIKQDWNKMAWDKYMQEVPLKRGALSFVKACYEKGLKLGIATSNSRDIVEEYTKVSRIKPYFSSIMTACDAKKGKPAPDIYLLTAKELEAEPGRCLVFEDIIPGIQAGKAAGMKVCAVEDPYSACQRAEKIRLADYYMDDYQRLLEGAAV